MADEIPPELRLDELTAAELRSVGQNVRQVFYWERKDLATYIVLTKHLLATAIDRARSGGEGAAQFDERVFGLGYDLASMTWPGWDEAGVELTPEAQATGLAAAEYIARLGDEHDVDPRVQHNSYWMLGAHRLTAGDVDGARQAWQRSRDLDVHDDDTGMAAWLALVDEVAGANPDRLDSWLAKLDDGDEPAQGRAAQIRTVRHVLSRLK